MPDLYAINLHLQERLERASRREVGAAEAARWLDKAGLLPNRSNGPSLKSLLSIGRIAGQERRPDRTGGKWWIRRLAESKHPNAIRQARQRLRTYLPLERGHLHSDWPLSRDNPEFWTELGKTVAMFGDLEHSLSSACYALTRPPADPARIRPEQVPDFLKWHAKVEASRTDPMRVLTDRLIKQLKEDGRVSHTVRHDLRERLDELRPWRNALCHGAWLGFSGDGAGVLSHHYKDGDRVTQFQPRVTVNELAGLRTRIVDTILRVAEVGSIAGYTSAIAAVLRRKYEPRNTPPEPE